MSEPSKTSIEQHKPTALTYEDALAALKSFGADISEHDERRTMNDEREVPGSILLTVKAYIYALCCLVEGREELAVEDFPAVYEVSRVFSGFLRDAREYFEVTASESESLLLHLDEEGRTAGEGRQSIAADITDLRNVQEEFRREWPKTILFAIKTHICDLSKLVKGKDELDVKDFLAVYEASCVFPNFLQEEKKYVEASAGGRECPLPQLDESLRTAGAELTERHQNRKRERCRICAL